LAESEWKGVKKTDRTIGMRKKKQAKRGYNLKNQKTELNTHDTTINLFIYPPIGLIHWLLADHGCGTYVKGGSVLKNGKILLPNGVATFGRNVGMRFTKKRKEKNRTGSITTN